MLFLLYALAFPTAQAQPFNDRLLGDLAGVRSTLAESGIDLGIEYSANVWNASSGGVKHGTVYNDNLNITLDVDGTKAYGLDGNSLRINFLNNFGGNINSYAGSIEGIDSQETTPSTFRLYELWVQQKFLEGKVSALAGLYDLNSEFFFTDMTANFLKPTAEVSQEIAQTGQSGPSIFPVTSVAARIKIAPTESTYVQAAVLDGEPGNADRPRGTHIDFEHDDGVLMVAEAGFIPGATEDGAHNKLAIGLWKYSEEFDDQIDLDGFGNPVKRDSQGVYGLATYRFYETAEGQNLGAFLRSGAGDGDTGQTKWSYVTGFVAGGWVPARPEGEFGLLFSQAHNSNKFMAVQAAAATPTDRNEYGFELYYRDTLMPGISIQPDIQYIKNPGTDPTLDDATILGLRTNFSF